MKSFIKKIAQLFTSQKPKENEELTEGSTIRAIVVTDLGNVRKNNEDAGYFVRPNDLKVREEKGFLGIVADGMGGHAAGEVASHLAVETIRSHYYSSLDDTLMSLENSFTEANYNIFNQALQNSRRKGMGTTATAVVIKQGQVYFAHVGDSRLYLLKDAEIHQLSTDHTYVQELLNRGEIDKEKAASHPERNVLTRALGTKANVKVETQKAPFLFNEGNRLLLCSDGLYDYYNESEIQSIASQSDLKSAAYELIATAKSRGGHDNITVVLIEAIKEIEPRAEKVTTDLEDLVAAREKETKETVLPPLNDQK